MDPILHDDRLTTFGLFFEAFTALTRAVDGSGAMPPNFEVLLRLARSEGQRLRMTDLAAQCGLTPSGLSRAVDRLAHDGLVERVRCPEDARGAFAHLTPKGNKVTVAALKQHLADVQEYLIDALTKEQRAQLESICRTLRDRLNPSATAGATAPS